MNNTGFNFISKWTRNLGEGNIFEVANLRYRANLTILFAFCLGLTIIAYTVVTILLVPNASWLMLLQLFVGTVACILGVPCFIYYAESIRAGAICFIGSWIMLNY
jgi:hypothetical protein